MDIVFKKGNKCGNSTLIENSTLEKIIELLHGVDCTCVWSDVDNQYIKVNDIPQELINDIEVSMKISKNL